ncbi:MAG: site-specific integrase [Candidatus Ratteibacteria bacterium]|jgi:integrase
MGIYKKGKNYYIDYYVNGKRKREKIGLSKSLAELVLKKRKIEIAEGKFLDKKKEERTKFKDFANEFIEVYAKNNKKSWKRDILSINNLNKSFADKCLSRITPYEIENYKNKRKNDGVSEATINRELACLKIIFSKAVEWGRVMDNPVKRIKFFRENNQRQRYLPPEELKRVLKNAREPFKTIILVALGTGFRQANVVNLRWKDINLTQRKIYLNQEDTKSGEREFKDMIEPVYNALSDVRLNQQINSINSEYVFISSRKTKIAQGSVQHYFRKLMKRLDIPDFHFHDLRHVYGSYMAMFSNNLRITQELMGHKSIQSTMRYAHFIKDYKQGTIKRYEKWMDTFWTPGKEEEKVETDKVLVG